MAIKKITIFETSDGTKWDNLQQAEHHQAFIDITQFFRDGLEDMRPTLDANHVTDPSFWKDAVALLVWNHREIVKGILDRAQPPTDDEKLSAT